MPDKELDKARFLREALRHEHLLRDLLWRYTRNHADADDLLQEVYARLLSQGGSDSVVVRSVRGFAVTTAKRIAIDFLRARRKPEPPEVSIDLMTEEEHFAANTTVVDVEGLVNAQQELHLLAVALGGVSKRTREVFVLRKIYGFSQEEIAQLLGISEHTVERHVGNAARHCADYLCSRSGSPTRYSVMEHVRRIKRRAGL
jgi:RNA polymerase sigma-70 factor (ECF subfamily)